MSNETTAPYGAWCALKSVFPSDEDIRTLRSAGFKDPIPLLRALSLPDKASSVFLIESILLERYASAIRSVSNFFTPISSGTFTFLREEFDWWNIMVLVKNTLGRRNGALISELMFNPPVSTIPPPDPPLSGTTDDIGGIIMSYADFFPRDTLDALSSGGLRAEDYHHFECLISAIKLIRLIEISARLGGSDRTAFADYIHSEFSAIALSSSSADTPHFLSKVLSRLKEILPPSRAIRHAKPGSCDNFDSVYSRFIDLVDARRRISGFCASLCRMGNHVRA